MIKTGHEDEGYQKNEVDPFIHVRKHFILVCYIDYYCIFCKEKVTIDTLLKNLSKTFKLTNEGELRLILV